MVVSFESTVRIVSCAPVGKAGIVPTHVPAKRLCFELGDCLAGFVGEALASDFGFGFGLALGALGVSIGSIFGAGVGLSGTS
jgi:hypothetical protein